MCQLVDLVEQESVSCATWRDGLDIETGKFGNETRAVLRCPVAVRREKC